MPERKLRYSKDHWLRSSDPEAAIHACMEQQSKAYSKVKTRHTIELLGDLKGACLLDYGCGAGFFAVMCAKAGAELVVGVDAEPHALLAAKYFAAKEGVSNRCLFICTSRFPSLLPQMQFDLVLLKDVIEHVKDELALIKSAARAIFPGGSIVLSTQNMVSLNYLIEGTYHRFFRNEKNWYGWDPTHLRFYTPRSLEELLKKAGLRCIEWRSSYILPYKLPPLPFSKGRFFRIDFLSVLDKTLGKRFPLNRFGWNITVKAANL